MPANSTVLITSHSHAQNLTLETITGDKVKGAGFYGMGDGLHTVQIQVTNFTGGVTIQATLATDPQEEDWFNVYEYAASNSDENFTNNFTGNFVWIRAVVNYTAGSVNRILLNY